MAKFVFRLQSVLNIKSRLEEQQRLNFASARKRLDEEEEKLNKLYSRRDFYEEEGKKLREKTLVVTEILENEEAIVRIKEYISDQTLRVKEAEDNLELERRKLVEAMKEKKTYEKLRENAFDEFLKESSHTEAVENDEHNSFVYGRRQLSGE